MTLKDQLDEANTKLSAAESARDGYKAQHEAEVKAHEASKQKLAAVEGERDAEKQAHANTKTQLSSAEKERDDLAAKDKDASAKAAEQLAKNGIAPSAKDSPGNLDPSASDPAALWESYAAADPAKQAQMRAQHGSKLDEAAAAYDRLGK